MTNYTFESNQPYSNVYTFSVVDPITTDQPCMLMQSYGTGTLAGVDVCANNCSRNVDNVDVGNNHCHIVTESIEVYTAYCNRLYDTPNVIVNNCLGNYNTLDIDTLSCTKSYNAANINIHVCLANHNTVDDNKAICLLSHNTVSVINRRCSRTIDHSEVMFCTTVSRDATDIPYSNVYTFDEIASDNIYDYVGDVVLSGTCRKGLIVKDLCLPFDKIINYAIANCSRNDATQCIEHGLSEWVDLPLPIVTYPSPTGQTIITTTKENYTMLNVTNAALSTGEEIGLSQVNLTIDAESYTWRFSADLVDISQKHYLLPKSDGTYNLINVTINGVTWQLLITKTITKRVFGKTQVSINGQSLSALLGEPFSKSTSVSIDTTLTNQQIAEQIIDSSWLINWELPVWSVPASSYSYHNKSPIQGLLQLVKDCGGMIIPHKNAKELTIKPRYPVYPWNYNITAPDRIITDSMIFSMTEEPSQQTEIDGVYIHGAENNGIIALCRMIGTAGAKLATTTSNRLMVDNIALRSLGERVLAGKHAQPLIRTLSTPFDVDNGIGLFNIGDFVRVDITGYNAPVFGIVSSLTVVVGETTIRQRIGISDETENSFTAISKIFNTELRMIGTLISTSNNVSIIQLISGDSLNVEGTGTVGDNYYIKDGKLDGIAPSLPSYEIIIG